MTKRTRLLISTVVAAGIATGTVAAFAAGAGGEETRQQVAFGGHGHGGDGHGPWMFHSGPRYGGPGGPGPHDRGGPGGMPFGGHGGRGIEMLTEKFDTNKDGKISQAEIDAVQVEQIKSFDKDGDGSLSLQEYQALWTQEMQEPMVRGFQRFDRDGDAKVTAGEFGDHLDHLVQHLDRNNDGVIDATDLERGPGPGGPGGPGGPEGQGGPGGPPPPPPAE